MKAQPTTVWSAYAWARRLVPAVLGVMLAVLLGGCGTKPGVIFPPLADAPRWPAAPDPARIVYVGSLATSADLKAGTNGFEQLGHALFGKAEAHGMLTPMAVCTDGADRVFVADSNGQCVHVFNLATREYAKWVPGKKDPALSMPVGLAWDAARQQLLVSDSVGGCLFVFGSDGKYVKQLGVGEFQRPVGVAVDAKNNRVLVVDTKANELVALAPDGRVVQRVGERGTRAGQFNYPTYVAVGPDGRVYVSDSLNFRVQELSPALKPLRSFGRKGDLPGYFAQPKGIAVDRDSHVYVVDAQFEAVQIFDESGQILMDFGSEGAGPGQFWLPAGMYIDAQNRIWVADSYNKRIDVFEYLNVPAETQP